MSKLNTNDHLLENAVTSRLISDLHKKLEDFIIEGLKRKGFEFENVIDLENFIKERCKTEDNIQKEQKTYFVDNVPFFLHNYKIEISNVMQEDRDYVLRANYGSHVYL
jgi:hypothetical protein